MVVAQLLVIARDSLKKWHGLHKSTVQEYLRTLNLSKNGDQGTSVGLAHFLTANHIPSPASLTENSRPLLEVLEQTAVANKAALSPLLLRLGSEILKDSPLLWLELWNHVQQLQ